MSAASESRGAVMSAKYKAFQGANGWYVAAEDKNGFHRQPTLGANLSEKDARRQARNLNSDWCPLCGGHHAPGNGTPGYSCWYEPA